MTINYKDTYDALINSNYVNKDLLDNILNVMKQLDHKYFRIKAKNDLKWFQFFLNGWWLETELNRLNPGLKFIENNHDNIGGQDRGNYIPDFEYTTLNGTKVTIDSKTFYNIDKFNKLTNKDFEGANYCLAFIMSEKKFYYRKLITNNNVCYSYTAAEPITNTDPVLAELILPEIVSMIGLNCDAYTNEVLPNVLIPVTNYTYRVRKY